MLNKVFIQPKSLILIFTITAIVVVSSALIELFQSRDEMLEIMQKQGHSILETMLISSGNALLANEKIETEVKRRLLNNVQSIKLLEQKGVLSNSALEKFALENNINRINIFNSSGEKIFSSHKDLHHFSELEENPAKYILPILEQETDTVIIGIKSAKMEDEQRYAVAVATQKRNIIALNINASELQAFQKEVGFGVLLKKLTDSQQIVYAVLQDEDGLIAASGKFDDLDSIDSSTVLQQCLEQDSYNWRIYKTNNEEVFEALHPFVYNGEVIGIFRLGLSLEPLRNINSRLTRRIIIITILLLVFGFITISFVFVKQNFSLLSKRFESMESYSTKIIDNVNDGIVVLDSDRKVQLINNAAQLILKTTEQHAKGRAFELIFNSDSCSKLWSNPAQIQEIECSIDGNVYYFLFSLNEFLDASGKTNYVLVFRDLTEQKQAQKQTQRNEKMISMGKLASSVAHEIRNPLNSIGTIAQQIRKDFAVKENASEFESLTKVVYDEVKRINETVESFLQFAKPMPFNPESFTLQVFFNELSDLYKQTLKQRGITLTIQLEYAGAVFLDKSQMKQAFINLIENSIDSVKDNGEISIRSFARNNSLNIVFSDNGIGIPSENLPRVFELYFTSKAKGNGIGLSIVHRIINDHSGNIGIESNINNGTKFLIKLPITIA